MYIGLVETLSPLGKKIYQSKVKGKKQLDPDRVRLY